MTSAAIALAPILVAITALAGVIVLALAALKGWQGWLALKLREIECRQGGSDGSSIGMARIELADLRERIRKLESIAAGVDL